MKILKGLSLLLALGLALSQNVQAQLSDVTQPGDAITATSDNSPGSEGVTNAIDNAPTKYLNFDISDTGFTVTPSVGLTVVRGLSLQSANDGPDRDPVTYTLEGSYDGENFTEVSSGDVADFPERFHTNYIFFDNNTPYLTYRLLFPTVDNSTCCMQIAEVEFLGTQAAGDVTQPGDLVTATSDNSPGSEGVTNAIDNAPTKYLNFDISDTGFTVTPSVGMTVVNGLSLQSANDGPDRDPITYLLEGSYDGTNFAEVSSGDVADFPDRFHTNYIFFDNSTPYLTYRLLFPTVDGSTCCMQIAEVEFLGSQAPGDVTQPGDAITATSDNSPGSEGVTNAIDGQPTKYLNFDISDTGFTVTPTVGLTIVNGLSLQSANDGPDRDPITYSLEGSYDGATFTEISSGDVADFPERFQTNYIFFDNSTAYLTYRLIFPTVDGSTCCMQIAEVEFLGVQLPGDVTQPGDAITATSDNSPGSEGVTNAIDNSPTKYLNFDISDTGFTVTPSVGLTEIVGISLQSANDGPDRDPVTYSLEGSYDGVNFSEVSSGSVADFPERFFTNYIFFDNTTPYLTYRVLFPTVDGSTCCMQIAEVELYPRPGGDCSDLTFVDSGLIRLQPSDTPVLAGATATMTVVPTGPWNVQWQSKASGADDFSEISGATSASISVSDVGAADDGTLFRAIVSTPGCEGQISNEIALNIFEPSSTVSIGYSWIGGGANGAPTAMDSTDIAGFHPQAYWNNLNGGSGDDTATISGFDEDGTPVEAAPVDSNNAEVSGIGMEFTTDGTWGVGTGDGNPTQRMLNGMVRTNTKDPEVDEFPEVAFFGVPAGSHTVILYSVQVPLEFFDMNVEVEGGNGVQNRYIRPQNSDEFNPSPGFVLVTAETPETRSVGNMLIFSDVEPNASNEIIVRFYAPNGDIQGPGLNAMQLVLNPPAAPPVPTITQSPLSTNGVEGGGLELSVEVSGDDLSIQWFKNGQPIGGATGTTYAIGALSATDAGSYNVAVTNPAGRILSRTAVVNVLESPDITGGLLAHFKFDGNGDNSAGGSAASLENGAGFGSGQIGQALELNGVDQYAFVPDFAKSTDALTVSTWVNVSSVDWGPIVRNWAPGTTTGRRGSFQLGVNFPFDAIDPQPTGVIEVGPNIPTARGTISDGDRNSWHHIAMSANGGAVTLYWDGEVVGNSDYLGSINEPLFPWLAIGAVLDLPLDDDGNIDFSGDPVINEAEFAFGGSIDDLAIWGRSLSGVEIASVFAAGSDGKSADEADSVLITEPGDVVLPPVPGGGPLAAGAVVAINFGADEPAGAGSAVSGAAGVLGTVNWNNLETLTGDGAALSADVDGASVASGVTVSWTSNNTWSSGGRSEDNNSAPEGDDRNLMIGYLDTNGEDPNSVVVSGLADDATYDVVVYTKGGVIGRGGEYTIGDQTFAHSDAAPFSGDYVFGAAGDYLVFKDVSGSSFELVGLPTTGSPPRAPINGIEIVIGGGVEVPEPAGGISSFSVDGGNLVIEYTGTLKAAAGVTGPYTAVDGASSPATIAADGDAQFYIAD
jgi:hypothetical protein